TAEFLAVAMNVRMFEGYGATETGCGGAVQDPRDPLCHDNVGRHMGDSELKLVSVPEMDYLVTDKPVPRGELYMRGPSIMKGYWNDEEKTRETLTHDGWYKSGDIATFDENGNLSLIDRKRNIFKLSQDTSYVSAKHCENVVESHPLIALFVLYASRFESFCLGVAMPSRDNLQPFLEEKGLMLESWEETLAQPAVVAAVTQEVNSYCRENKLRSFEIPKTIILVSDTWGIDSGEMTPSYKVKRNVVIKRHETQLLSIYALIKKAGLRPNDFESVAEICVECVGGRVEADASVASGVSGISGLTRVTKK
ncbi:hypothetical protein KIPB_011792, partial [Kipferlia bialata]